MTAKRENSLFAVQAQNGMWRALWEVAVDEAYTARDAKRRTDEIQGMPERAVVEVYFNYHPEMRTWAEGHIAAGTCEVAIIDLHERLELVRKQRKEDRARNDAVKAAIEESMRVPSFEDVVETDDWMAPFKAGPATWPTTASPDTVPTIEGQIPNTDQTPVGRIKTGPRPEKREAIEDEMRRQIKSGGMTLAKLRSLKKKELPVLFGGKETTCYEAQKAVLATPTNSD